MANAGKNGARAQAPDGKSYVLFTLAMSDFQSLQLFHTPTEIHLPIPPISTPK